MTDINFFLVKRAGRNFSFLKRAGRHQKEPGRRALQKGLGRTVINMHRSILLQYLQANIMTKALLWPLAFGITSKQFLQICHRKSTQFVSIASVSSLYSQEPGSIHTFNVAVGLAEIGRYLGRCVLAHSDLLCEASAWITALKPRPPFAA